MRNVVGGIALVLMVCVRGAMAAEGAGTRPAVVGDKDLAAIVEKHHLPGIVAGMVEGEKMTWVGAAGIRKWGSPEAMTVEDQMHLGSDTKAMTAVLIAQLVEKKQLSWGTTLAEVYPGWKGEMDPAMARVTVRNLLDHTAGLPHDVAWPMYALLPGGPMKQRRAVAEAVVQMKPETAPGSKYSYSNIGFVMLGAILEEKTGKAWEVLMKERLFGPLGMKSAGFGLPGEKGKVAEPWEHVVSAGKMVPMWTDNPEVMGPAGTVHCSIADWGKFVSLFVREGENGVIGRETMKALTTATDTPEYAGGWGVTERPWAGGKVLTHAGSNGMWYCVVWAAPVKHFAVMAMTNVGGEEAGLGCDEAVSMLILRREKGK